MDSIRKQYRISVAEALMDVVQVFAYHGESACREGLVLQHNAEKWEILGCTQTIIECEAQQPGLDAAG